MLLFHGLLTAQDTILLLNGRTVPCRIVPSQDTLVHCTIIRHGKEKPVTMDMNNVYSLNYAGGTRTILYRQNATKGFEFTAGEMNDYILGEQSAMKKYRGTGVFAGGVAAGAAGGAAGLWGYLVPVAYVGAFGFNKVHSKQADNIPAGIVYQDHFRQGFRDAALRKKSLRTIEGSLVGLAVATVVKLIVNSGK